MISFKQFLKEEWRREELDDHVLHHHVQNVAGHEVHVKVHKLPHWYDTRGNHNVSFFINGTMNHGDAGHKSTETSMHILKHVHKTINDFVSTHKPRVLSFSATDNDTAHRDAKDKLYGGLAKKIAKQHGGEHKSKFLPMSGVHDHKIEFNHSK